MVSSERGVPRERARRWGPKAGARRRAEASAGLEPEKTCERTKRAGTARAPRYLQRSSRTLPGISTRFVSMMRTHRRSSASRLRAAGDEGTARRLRLAGERAARRRRRSQGREGGRGEARSLPSGAFSPGPPEAGPRRGRSPWSHAPVLLERPNGKLGSREPERVSQ